MRKVKDEILTRMNEILELDKFQTLNQSELHVEDPNILYGNFLNKHL